MVAAAAKPQSASDVTMRVEVRGAVARLWKTTEGEIIISGPAGTGKTRATLEYIHWRCQQDALKVLILRKTLKSLSSSALVTYREQVLHEFDGKRSALDGVTYFGGNDILPAAFNYERTGSQIVVGGIDQASKIKSTEWDIVFINEVTELNLDEFETVTGRTDRPSISQRPPSLVVGDCNPDAPTHWIKQREATGACVIWYSRHEDNPAMFDRQRGEWTEAGKRYLARLEKLTGVRYQRLRLGKWVAAEGQVFDTFDRSLHVISRDRLKDYGLAHPSRCVAGVDWGWTKPGVITVAAIGGDTQVGIVGEVYRVRRGRDWWIQTAWQLMQQYGIDLFVCDPSEPEYINAWVEAGLPAVPAVNTIKLGIATVSDRLAKDDLGRVRWVVVADCNQDIDPELEAQNLPLGGLQEVEVYVWPNGAAGAKEKPVDEHNHAMDTWRYIAMEAAGVSHEPEHVIYDDRVSISPI